MTGVVYLGGGGTARDEGLLWSEMLSGCRRLLYWPFALEGDMLAGAETWLRGQVLAQSPSVEIRTWTTLKGRDPSELDGFDLVFVGGGNTFLLLHHLRAHGFVGPLRQWVEAGGDYYGGSAGAILATESIATAAELDGNDVGLVDLEGLGLLRGFGLLPHYTLDQQDRARSMSRELARPIVAVPETAGLVVDRGDARTVGPDAVWTITGGGSIRHPPGHLLSPIVRP